MQLVGVNLRHTVKSFVSTKLKQELKKVSLPKVFFLNLNFNCILLYFILIKTILLE